MGRAMRITALRRRRATEQPGITGAARVGRRTSALVRRLRPGDIAVIDHLDLDKVSADALVAAQVAAVVNVASSTSGRYPNLGPQVLVDAGVPLVDVETGDLMAKVSDGDWLRIDDGTIYRDVEEVAVGHVLDPESVQRAMQDARSGMSTRLEAFTANAQEYIRRERELLLDGSGVPEVNTAISGRHVVVVMNAFDFMSDLTGLKTYLREKRPVLVGVGAGADALLSTGYRPDVVVGDGEELSDKALTCGAEVLLHHDRGTRPSDLDRLERLGVQPTLFATSGTSEDAAMLLVATHGAELVVAVGSTSSLLEFLDQGRSTMASAFITRLCLGPRLVDAKSVHHLYRSRVRTWQVLLLALVALVAVALAVAATPIGNAWWHDLQDQFRELGDQVRGQVS
jgi:uncharacterized membrane-anchored protein